MLAIIQENKKETDKQLQALADGVQKANNANDGIKAAITFAKK
jgi:hypothetical protein